MTEQAPSTPRPSKGDERNVVAVAPTAPEATLEERLGKIWKENRTFILVGVVVVILVILGRAAWEAHVRSREHAISEAFGAAESVEAKLAFAREHAGHPLAGLALLAAADAAYEASDYGSALSRYKEAAAALKDPIIASRARLGVAIASLQGGSVSEGEGLLRELGADVSVPAAIRAEAWFHLASHSLDTSNPTVAREALAKIDEVAPGSMWSMRASTLSAKLPPEETPPPASPSSP